MTNVYMLVRTWRYLLIIPSVLLFLLFWLLFIFAGGSLDMPVGAWVMLITVTAISGGIVYGAVTSKITISPEGIENISFGIQVKATWDKVKKIELTPDGFVNLIFKESIWINRLATILLFLYPYDKTIMLSPYTGDLATSNLLKDIAKYVPNSTIPAFVAQQKRPTKTYQEAGVIGLYYLSWFMVWALFGISFQKRTEEFLAKLGLPNVDSILDFVGISLVLGLFFNSMSLLKRYNAEFINLDENDISHKARAYYLSPFVNMAIGFFVWTFLPTALKSEFAILLILLLAQRISLPISSKIEKFLFQENIE